MRNKKDLIVISAHCPTPSKEEKLRELVEKIQDLRDWFDILVVSHTPIAKEICDMVDHFYYDRQNEMLTDFDLTYMAWFRTEGFYLETSLVYNKSTALTIARQIRYAINFADFWGYEKIHYMEYDFIYKGDDVILDINEKLDEYDTVMFDHPSSRLFASSVYFAFNTKFLFDDVKNFSKEKFLDLIRNPHVDLEINGKNLRMTNHAKMTENLNVILLSQEGRKCLFLPNSGIDQSEDSHSNQELKWAFPIYDIEKNCIMFFVHNNFNSLQTIDVTVNGGKTLHLECPPGNWMLNNLCDFEGEKIIEVLVDGNLNKKIEIKESNKKIFTTNNYITFNK